MKNFKKEIRNQELTKKQLKEIKGGDGTPMHDTAKAIINNFL